MLLFFSVKWSKFWFWKWYHRGRKNETTWNEIMCGWYAQWAPLLLLFIVYNCASIGHGSINALLLQFVLVFALVFVYSCLYLMLMHSIDSVVVFGFFLHASACGMLCLSVVPQIHRVYMGAMLWYCWIRQIRTAFNAINMT